MMMTTPKANVQSTATPSSNGPPADGRDVISHQPDYNGQPEKQKKTENPEPKDLNYHRNRRLINSKVCGMSCEKQQNCKKLEKVLYFFEKIRLI